MAQGKIPAATMKTAPFYIGCLAKPDFGLPASDLCFEETRRPYVQSIAFLTVRAYYLPW